MVKKGNDSEVIGKKKMTAREREELLIENFVGLQSAMTNLSVKFGSLSDNIVKLLGVFEEAARSFASGGRIDDKDMLKKIDSLLEQNKTIAMPAFEIDTFGLYNSSIVNNTPSYAIQKSYRLRPPGDV